MLSLRLVDGTVAVPVDAIEDTSGGRQARFLKRDLAVVIGVQPVKQAGTGYGLGMGGEGPPTENHRGERHGRGFHGRVPFLLAFRLLRPVGGMHVDTQVA